MKNKQSHKFLKTIGLYDYFGFNWPIFITYVLIAVLSASLFYIESQPEFMANHEQYSESETDAIMYSAIAANQMILNQAVTQSTRSVAPTYRVPATQFSVKPR